LKKIILFFALILASISLKAQSGYNYEEFAIGVDASYIKGYTNIPRQDSHPAFSLNFIYNFNPYLPIVAEFQKGTLSGGGLTVDKDKYGRMYTNKYTAFVLHADFQMGAGIDYEGSTVLSIIKNFYVGSGIGLIMNSNTVQRTNLIAANGPLTYVFPGSDKSTNFTVPLRVGYEFKIYDSYNEPSMAIDIGYIHNFVFGEGIDGYDDPTGKFKNNATNQYRQIVIGIKYNFGTVVSYNKLIRHFNQ
jgi:hypothetical protein